MWKVDPARTLRSAAHELRQESERRCIAFVGSKTTDIVSELRQLANFVFTKVQKLGTL